MILIKYIMFSGGSCTLEIGNVSIILEITFGNGGEHL